MQSRFHLGAWKKFTWFVTISHILMQYGRLILEYELLKELFLLLKAKITPSKHWSYNCDWQIAKVLHDMVHDKSDVCHFKKVITLMFVQMMWWLLMLGGGSIFMHMWWNIGSMFQFPYCLNGLWWVQSQSTSKMWLWMPWVDMVPLTIKPWPPSSLGVWLNVS